MKTPAPSGHENTSRILAEIEHALSEARALAIDGDLLAVQHRVKQVRQLLPERNHTTPLPEEFESVQALWLDLVSDLMLLLEDRGAYFDALSYARDLCQYDLARQSDLRRLTELYVLNGSRIPFLTTLQRRFRDAQRGEGSLALIQGLAGIGKSSLARACLDWASRQGAITAIGRGYEQGIALPLTPWQETLRSLAQTTGTSIDHLPTPFGNQPPAESADSLIAQIGTYLRDLASDRVFVLLLDDLHWADQATLDLLEYVTRHIDRVPLLLLATYRSDEVDRNHLLSSYLPAYHRDRPIETIRLVEFELDDTVRFVEGYLGPRTQDLAQYLHQRSDGHPLFLGELFDDLQEQNLLHQDADGRWLPPDQRVPIPTLLRQVIFQRVARLGQPCETLLDVASVIGEVWTLTMAETLLDWPEEQLLDELKKALSARIIEADDARGERYCFSHGLIREALYRRQIPRRRRHLHARIVEHLEGLLGDHILSTDEAYDEIVGELAHHTYRAERWSDTFRFCRIAADRAAQRNAFYGVLHYGRQALAAAQQSDRATSDDLLDLHEQLGHAALLLGWKDEALANFTQMIEAANDINEKARVANALFRLAEVQERSNEYDRSLQTRQAALALITTEAAPKLLARFHWSMAHHGTSIGDLDETRRHLAEAERHARAADEKQILIDCERHQTYVAIFQSEYVQGERLSQNGLARARSTSDAPQIAVACFQLGFVQIERGAYERARQTLLEGLDQDDAIGETHYTLIRIRNLLGYLHREVGDLETAIRWNQEALDANRQSSHRAIECACYSLIDMAANQLAVGRLEASENLLRQFEAMAEGAHYIRYRYFNRAQLFQAELALVRTEYDLALANAIQAVDFAAQSTMRKNIVRGLLFQGQALTGLARLPEAATQLERAVKLSDDIGHAALRWQTRLALANVPERPLRNADHLLREANEIVSSIAEDLHEQHLRDSFLTSDPVMALKVRAGILNSIFPKTAPSKEAQPAGLTRREVEVLKLVTTGLTDRQIGEHLHIAVRTVNTHITNILNKTGCENRTAATAFAIQHGLVGTGST